MRVSTPGKHSASQSTVAIAGATGFVGTALRQALGQRHHVVGLSRSRRPTDPAETVEWRTCDLFSLRELEEALRGADVAIYLVHSMLPTARLTQGSFADLDLLLADNFSRAAAAAGVRHVLYVGGFVPTCEDGLSEHLESRFEVERTLASRVSRATALRSGIILGRGSSSLWILLNLVRRLPVMILPRWTRSSTQPIAIADLVRAVERCLERPDESRGAFDIGGPDVLTYRELMLRIARFLGLRRWMFGVHAFSPRFSRLWVRLFGSAPAALVSPLIESLRHDMVAEDNPLQRWLLPGCQGLDEALAASMDDEARPLPPPSSIQSSPAVGQHLRRSRTVRSVQRLPLPAGRDAAWVARTYMDFLPRVARRIVRVEVEPSGACRFFLGGSKLLLLELQHAAERSSPDRQVFDVVGGLLLSREEGPVGRLELREVLDGETVLAAVHDFRPALPWALYNLTQARVHLHVMRGFARHLRAEGASCGLQPG